MPTENNLSTVPESDHWYLLRAWFSGYVSIHCPQARASLLKLDYLAKAKIRDGYFGGHLVPHCYVLTKKGSKRVANILDNDPPKAIKARIKHDAHHKHVALSKRK
jgi:hypothetical protein